MDRLIDFFLFSVNLKPNKRDQYDSIRPSFLFLVLLFSKLHVFSYCAWFKTVEHKQNMELHCQNTVNLEKCGFYSQNITYCMPCLGNMRSEQECCNRWRVDTIYQLSTDIKLFINKLHLHVTAVNSHPSFLSLFFYSEMNNHLHHFPDFWIVPEIE